MIRIDMSSSKWVVEKNVYSDHNITYHVDGHTNLNISCTWANEMATVSWDSSSCVGEIVPSSRSAYLSQPHYWPSDGGLVWIVDQSQNYHLHKKKHFQHNWAGGQMSPCVANGWDINIVIATSTTLPYYTKLPHRPALNHRGEVLFSAGEM